MSQSNPFKRDFRKSIFRDGTVFSQWMERVHEYGIEVRGVFPPMKRCLLSLPPSPPLPLPLSSLSPSPSPSLFFLSIFPSFSRPPLLPLPIPFLFLLDLSFFQDGDDGNTVPLFEGDVSQSQRTPSPHPPDENAEKERGESEMELGGVSVASLCLRKQELGSVCWYIDRCQTHVSSPLPKTMIT